MRHKPCAKPACPELVPTAQRYCAAHGGNSNWASSQQFRTASHANRLNNSHWRKLRRVVLMRDDYLCQECRRSGRSRPGNEVDHIIPYANGGDDYMENLQTLCRECHAKKTATESRAG